LHGGPQSAVQEPCSPTLYREKSTYGELDYRRHSPWPNRSVSAIGTLVGVSMFFSDITRLMLGRRASDRSVTAGEASPVALLKPQRIGGPMNRRALLLALSLISSTIVQAAATRVPLKIFTDLGLTSEQIVAIDAGRPVAKVLSWGGPSEVYVFGAVHVEGSRDTYLEAARDLRRLSGTPGYQGIGEIHEDATVADLSALSFDSDDVKALKNCREGSCDVQLPTSGILRFRDGVDWSRPDAADQANALARPAVLQLVQAYRRGGNEALGEYRDKQHAARVADQFETMIGRASALPDVLPELRRYLLEYPNAELAGSDSFFYWEKVSFGLKPTIRVNHAVIYRGRSQGRDFGAVAIKQLYATHYFHTALDMSVCVDDGATVAPHGFYLLTIKGSEQEGLTGVKGSILRKVVVDKTRSSLESALGSIKRSVEQSAPRSTAAGALPPR
jgi:hypothetical protein